MFGSSSPQPENGGKKKKGKTGIGIGTSTFVGFLVKTAILSTIASIAVTISIVGVAEGVKFLRGIVKTGGIRYAGVRGCKRRIDRACDKIFSTKPSGTVGRCRVWITPFFLARQEHN